MNDLIYDIRLALSFIERKALESEPDDEVSIDCLEYMVSICKYLIEIKGFKNEKLIRAINTVILTDNKSMAEYLQFLENIIERIKADGIDAAINILEKSSENKKLPKNITLSAIPDFYTLAQSHSFNALIKKLTTKLTNPSQFDIFGNGQIQTKDFKLFINGYNELVNGINVSASKLLDCLLITATASGLNNNTLVKLSLKEYMQMRGLKNEKETRKQVKRDIEALKRVSFEYVGQGKSRGSWLSVTLAGEVSGIVNGFIVFQFSNTFFKSLTLNDGKYLFMFLPKEALKLNDNANPYSYAFARKIAEHKRMNLGKPNENVISVRTLIDSCATFPSYDDVMSGNRNISDRIIEPFERDMDALADAFRWGYTCEYPTSYQEFTDACVHIQWLSYPDTNRLREEKTKQRKHIAENKTMAKKISELENKLKEVEKKIPEL